MKDLDMIDKQMEIGQTKIISHDGGHIIDYIELLFSPTTKAQFAPSEDNKHVRLCIKDVDLSLPQLECNITKSTLKDLIMGLKSVYHQMDHA